MSPLNRGTWNVERGMAAPPPRVSIVVPTRNCRVELARLLDSIERQTFRDLEVSWTISCPHN